MKSSQRFGLGLIIASSAQFCGILAHYGLDNYPLWRPWSLSAQFSLTLGAFLFVKD